MSENMINTIKNGNVTACHKNVTGVLDRNAPDVVVEVLRWVFKLRTTLSINKPQRMGTRLAGFRSLRSAQSFCGDLNFHSPHYNLSQSALVRSYLYLTYKQIHNNEQTTTTEGNWLASLLRAWKNWSPSGGPPKPYPTACDGLGYPGLGLPVARLQGSGPSLNITRWMNYPIPLASTTTSISYRLSHRFRALANPHIHRPYSRWARFYSPVRLGF